MPSKKDKDKEPTADDHYRRGEQLLGAGKFGEAYEAFDTACELDDWNGTYVAARAYARYLKDNKQLGPAKRQLLEAQKMEGGGRAASHLYLGKIAKLEGNDREAFEEFKQCLQITPGNVEARREARLYKLREKKEKQKKDAGLLGRFFKK